MRVLTAVVALSLLCWPWQIHLVRADENVLDNELYNNLPVGCTWDSSQFTVDCTGVQLEHLPVIQVPARKLILADTKLTRIDDSSLRYLVADLQYLDVSNNNITSFDENVFSTMKFLRKIKLSNNPFHCNCSLEWLRRAALQSKTVKKRHLAIEESANITCSSPMALKDKPLASLAGTVLECASPFCQREGKSCDPHGAVCTRIHGHYTCVCKNGYHGDGYTCTDIDECDANNKCAVNAVCTNTAGSYICSCHPGYHGNGATCTAGTRSTFQRIVDHLTNRERTAEIAGITAAFAIVIGVIAVFFWLL